MSTSERHVYIEGDQLLPQSRRPLPPSDIRDEERVLVHPPVAPSADENAYWRMGDAFAEHPKEAVFGWKNDPRGQYGFGHGIDRLPATSIFEFKPKPRKQGLPDFWEHGGLLVASTRLLDILLRLDPEAIVHKPIVMRDLDGNVIDEDHHFVDVIRCIDAVDYANSLVLYQGGGRLGNGERFAPYAAGYFAVRLLSDIDPSFKIFRHKDSRVIVSDEAKRELTSVKPKLRNIDFLPLASGI